MNKKLFSISLLCLSFLGLASCGDAKDSKTNESKTETTTAETTTKISTTTKVETTTTTIETSTIVEEKIDSYEKLIETTFGEDTIVYQANETNPYGFDLTKYGEHVSAIFYEPKELSDPYVGVSKEDFYKNYTCAKTYEDAIFRTNHGLVSGDINVGGYLPGTNGVKENNSYLRANTGTYILNTDGSYLGYIPNTTSNYRILFYKGAYVSLDDVAAYLLAFGELPSNSNYGTKDYQRSECLDTWGIYGRINKQHFSGDTEKFPYEPLLPNVNSIYYVETDFGTNGGYTYPFYEGDSEVKIYNDGTKFERGICRFVFVSDYDIYSIDERYVFYTYNHYNDFQEYLNYDGGFGERFGCESGGNLACSSRFNYNDTFLPSTQYISVITRQYSEIV